ncbi:hypothetical protein LCGC14_1750330 [marine sediment metagenome]|uniref:Uncharacterized protein n=1 Tax=marine sediment metagenome TaxID=412755 RepID=A0A0F9H438_9ZZZZ
MDRRQLAKNAFLGLCGTLLGKKVEEPVEPPGGPTSTEGGHWTSMEPIVIYPNHPAGSTEAVPPGWDFLNDPGEDVYNGTC